MSESEEEYGSAVWPNVDEQLRHSKVVHGSALEALIRNHQDFDILDPRELHDDLPFPLWLRVYIRKTHPELKFTGPRVVYPLIVKEIYHWMRHNQDLGGARTGEGVSGISQRAGEDRHGH